MTTFYHYTCDHGRAALGDYGTLRAVAGRGILRAWPSQFVWLTDLAVPSRDALGLTSNFISCDRIRFRYRALRSVDVQRWVDVAREAGPWREHLEGSPGARPKHWYVSTKPVPVMYDPPNRGRR